ncbi:MAG TPA: DUF421 domain-containing protein [Firmicutes bacterium]|nr:DUF421 domain-containing protein [Bacillota bacterium]
MQHLLADIWIGVYRTVILYITVIVMVRLVGKRTVAQLAPFDLAVIIIAGSVAAIPIENADLSVVSGIVPIAMLGILQYFLAWLNMRSRLLEKITQGTSTVLVQDGQILEENLKKERITMSDLNIMLRQKDVEKIGDVELATIEPDGMVSVIKKKQAQPITTEELQNSVLTHLNDILSQNACRSRQRFEELFSHLDVKYK